MAENLITDMSDIIDDIRNVALKERDKKMQELLMEMLTSLPTNNDMQSMQIPSPQIRLESLYPIGEPSAMVTSVEVTRDAATGAMIGWKEVVQSQAASKDAKAALSFKRNPGIEKGLRGSTMNKPFLPGGFESELDRLLEEVDQSELKSIDDLLDFENNLLTCPPGFSQGMDFTKSKVEEKVEKVEKVEVEDVSAKRVDLDGVLDETDFFSMMDFINTGSDALVIEKDEKEKEEIRKLEEQAVQPRKIIPEDALALENEVLAKPVAKVGKVDKGQKSSKGLPESKLEFAVKLDSSKYPQDFQNNVPIMARKYPFRLDPFQEHAVNCVEQGQSVFVAAHTSAGKTVVAEYAIALCKQHMTRAIYTSPIKALSNQKFRDFKIAFEDVGLITGDLQLHPEAFCLVMTTEILRSMLYNGSEVIRELEWVIFDEVHYINDTERGVVWEEVLIMLPSSVNIIMLSATVPNSQEFADWVGRIKNRTIYVISTIKRPVPLEHFLYTGTDGKTKDDRFLIVNSKSEFVVKGYQAALAARANHGGDKKKTGFGPKGPKTGGFNPRSEKNMWVALINHLETKELLPVVCFTFSRKRCDDNARMLTSIKLTTSKEETEIHHFFSKCVGRLKGTDKKLPQVLQMQELCKRGLAVHHSGILPILKEVVEMLFQQGFVKVLFATETFAMGVNMPARTVVFDSMKKHDGKSQRDLLPGEYIQMAGRAGRRGLDTIGTVILLCKGDVFESSDISKMMLGKPTKLDSKFRVTYGMLLNLLRVEELKVEDMLQRSFAENSSLKMVFSRKEDLKRVQNDLTDLKPPDCSLCNQGGIVQFHEYCLQYICNKVDLWSILFSYPAVSKMLTPGRVVVISAGDVLRQQVALLLKVETQQSMVASGGNKSFVVLIPIPEHDSDELKTIVSSGKFERMSSDKEELVRNIRDLAENLTNPGTGSGRLAKWDPKRCAIVEVPSCCVIGVTTKSIKVQTSAIFEDFQRRKQPRFRNDSPDRSTVSASRELCQIAESFAKNSLPLVEPGKDFQCSEMELLSKVQDLKRLWNKLEGFSCTKCLSFMEHFSLVQKLAKLREEETELKFLLSKESLQLLPGYQSKLEVLKRLGYVNASNMVELKGKVACELSHQELLVTELMLENILSELSPPEIAAVLSCTTCQFRSGDVELSDHMKVLRNKVLGVANRICDVQNQCAVGDALTDLHQELRFELMDVVYEWAKGVPFSQLMELTMTQEGLIVRCIQRLNEVCVDVAKAARLVGDTVLQKKMQDTSCVIKRDIVFAASLYTVT